MEIKDIAKNALIGLLVRLLGIALEHLANEMSRVARLIQGHGSDGDGGEISQKQDDVSELRRSSNPHPEP